MQVSCDLFHPLLFPPSSLTFLCCCCCCCSSGVTLTGKQWFGSIYRPDCDCGDAGSWCPASLHPFIVVHDVDGLAGRPMGSYTPLVDLLGHPHFAAKAVVFLMDGLYAGPTQSLETGPSPPSRFASAPFNGNWACSVFASQDPIALDSVAYDMLRNEPSTPLAHNGCVDNYLHEAALIPKSPSGTVYNPSGKAPLTTSLGCHEHRDPVTMLYSGNSGSKNGISLIRV